MNSIIETGHYIIKKPQSEDIKKLTDFFAEQMQKTLEY